MFIVLPPNEQLASYKLACASKRTEQFVVKDFCA